MRPDSLSGYLDSFASGLEGRGHQVRKMILGEMDIRFCSGCWACWWQSPGQCAFRDDMELLYPAILDSDLVVWAAPLVLGTVPALVKKVQDRLIPLVHPYFAIVKGEAHHRKRYANYPDLAFLAGPAAMDGPEDLALARLLVERFAVNMRGGFRFFATTADPVKEVLDAATAA
jgi:multimeric flavodoxin WrbA